MSNGNNPYLPPPVFRAEDCAGEIRDLIHTELMALLGQMERRPNLSGVQKAIIACLKGGYDWVEEGLREDEDLVREAGEEVRRLGDFSEDPDDGADDLMEQALEASRG